MDVLECGDCKILRLWSSGAVLKFCYALGKGEGISTSRGNWHKVPVFFSTFLYKHNFFNIKWEGTGLKKTATFSSRER